MTSGPNDKLVIDGLDGFRALVGKTVGPSDPVEVTRARIEHFCRAVDNDEWTHWDLEGAEGIRLFSPLKCGDEFTMSFIIAAVEERANGIAVRYDATYSRPGEAEPFALASFIIRYLED
jgi:acyl dehydratase